MVDGKFREGAGRWHRPVPLAADAESADVVLRAAVVSDIRDRESTFRPLVDNQQQEAIPSPGMQDDVRIIRHGPSQVLQLQLRIAGERHGAGGEAEVRGQREHPARRHRQGPERQPVVVVVPNMVNGAIPVRPAVRCLKPIDRSVLMQDGLAQDLEELEGDRLPIHARADDVVPGARGHRHGLEKRRGSGSAREDLAQVAVALDVGNLGSVRIGGGVIPLATILYLEAGVVGNARVPPHVPMPMTGHQAGLRRCLDADHGQSAPSCGSQIHGRCRRTALGRLQVRQERQGCNNKGMGHLLLLCERSTHGSLRPRPLA